MALLKNSPLAKICLAAIILMGISVWFTEMLCIAIIVAFIIFAVILLITAFVLRRRNSKSKKRNSAQDIMVCFVIFFIVSSILLVGSFNFFISDMGLAEKYEGETVEIHGIVDRVRYTYSYESALEVSISKINGEKVDLKAVLEFDTAAPIDRRDIFTLNGKVTAISSDESYLISDGFSMKLKADLYQDIASHGKSPKKWHYIFQHISDNLQEIFEEHTNSKTADLVGAMLLGKRENLDNDTVRNFRRTGISHMLALSGLHVTVIMGFIDFILKRLYLSKRTRSIALIIGALCYLALTGFSLSAARAVIMISCVYIAYLFGDDSDSITALFLSAVIIFAISPTALADLSFWMSFLATLGIITVSKIIVPLKFKLKKRPVPIQILVHLISAISITLAATVSVSLFSWLVFGEISLITVFTNLIFSPLTTLLIVLGVLLLIFNPIPFINTLFAFALDAIARVFDGLSSHLAHFRGITISMRYDFVKYIIPLMLLFTLIFVLVHLKRKWITVLPTAAAIAAFVICLLVYNNVNSEISKVSYIRNEKSEMLIISNTESASICDFSTGGYAHFTDAYDEAVSNCATEIENIIITHYHQYHAGSLFKLCKSYMIRNVYLPIPQNDSELEKYNDITLKLKSDNIKTNIIPYHPNDKIDLGENCYLQLSKKYYIDRSVHPMYTVKIDNNGEELLYLSSSVYESKEFLYELDSVEHLILGVHGPNIHSAPVLPRDQLIDTDTILIASPDVQTGNNEFGKMNVKLLKKCNKYSWDLVGKAK